MTTFEEDLVDVYYNLNNYFTIKNIPFSSPKKQKGGKGRGEIDILAVLIKDGKFMNCIHIEVSVSVTTPFPYNDTPDYITKKFFSDGAEKKIKDIVGNIEYSSILITSDFRKNAKELLRKSLSEKNVKIISIASTGTINYGTIILEVEYKNKTKKILIQTFTHIFFQLLKKFQEKRYMQKNFQDSRLRSIQHQLILMEKRDELKKLSEESKKDLK